MARPKGSRNKRTLDLDTLVRSYAEPAIKTLVEIMNDTTAPHAARATAANGLLKKSVPDLQSTALKVDGKLIIEINDHWAKT